MTYSENPLPRWNWPTRTFAAGVHQVIYQTARPFDINEKTIALRASPGYGAEVDDYIDGVLIEFVADLQQSRSHHVSMGGPARDSYDSCKAPRGASSPLVPMPYR